MVKAPNMAAQQLVSQWWGRAQIDYSDLFMRLYVAYNAWYRNATGADSDSDALRRLAERFVIWDDYIKGFVMQPLRSVVQQITILTALRPLTGTTKDWNGTVCGADDWRGLLLFWYTVRCNLFHGTTNVGYSHEQTQLKLAYESLNVFMTEIVTRMKQSFDAADWAQLTHIQDGHAKANDKLRNTNADEQRLYEKYIFALDPWNVDMIRAQKR